jgi:uncharacterized protein YecE (DUF72 family)
MDFGRLIDGEKLSDLDIHFPPIHSHLTPFFETELHLGLTVWGSEAFRGTLFEKSIPRADFLKAYSRNLDFIELNTTFYNIAGPEQIESWREEVANNPRFKFFPKISKLISHEGRLDHHFEKISAFASMARNFKSNLGACFLQLSPSFTPSRIHELAGFLELWPEDLKLNVEVRHLSWFKNLDVRDKLIELLKSKNVGWLVTDTPGIQDVLHQNIILDEMMIRFVTTGFHEKDKERMAMWSEQFKSYADAGVSDVYFFVHERDEWLCRNILEHMVELNKDQPKLRVSPLPNLVEEAKQLSLF